VALTSPALLKGGIGLLGQRWFPPGYELIMRLMNRQLVVVAERA
jgi:hypothetical protein